MTGEPQPPPSQMLSPILHTFLTATVREHERPHGPLTLPTVAVEQWPGSDVGFTTDQDGGW